MLMMFYLNVFYLPTLKDVVGHYKLWNEVISWFTQMMCTMFTFHRCPELQSNEIHALYDKHKKESYSLFSISFLITFSAISC